MSGPRIQCFVTDAYGDMYGFEDCVPVVGTSSWMLPIDHPSSARKEFLGTMKEPELDWHKNISMEVTTDHGKYTSKLRLK